MVRSGVVRDGTDMSAEQSASVTSGMRQPPERGSWLARLAPPADPWRSALPWLGPLATLALAIGASAIQGRGLHLPDPLAIYLLPVVGSALLGGLRAGLVAAAIGATATLLALADPPFVTTADNAARAAAATAALIGAAALCGWVHDRLGTDQAEVRERRNFMDRMRAFLAEVGTEPLTSVYVQIAARLPEVIPCDLVAITLVDPRDGRHFVRAIHGADPGLMGVEVLPGVGVAGQAIRDRHVVVAERRQPVAAAPDSEEISFVAAVPIMEGPAVQAAITVGRRGEARSFSALEADLLTQVATSIALLLDNAELRAELAESALHDPLTGLYNRTYLDASLDQLLALRRRLTREDRPPMAVLLFDIDRFRRFNDDHGRETGDRVLQQVAGVLIQRFRSSDTVARVGGDGFLVVMNGATRAAAASAAAEVRARVRELPIVSARGEPLRVSVSAGCATFEEADPGAQAVIRTAEATLDTARWSGRDAIVSI